MVVDSRRILVVLAHAAVGWALCFATIGIGLAVTTLQPTLIVHAIGAPIYFSVVSIRYFTRYGYTTPTQTALVFTGFVVVVDFFLVALVVLRSLEVFASPLGTWIPFVLIFLSTWLTGHAVTRRRTSEQPVHRGDTQAGPCGQADPAATSPTTQPCTASHWPARAAPPCTPCDRPRGQRVPGAPLGRPRPVGDDDQSTPTYTFMPIDSGVSHSSHSSMVGSTAGPGAHNDDGAHATAHLSMRRERRID